MSEVKNTEIKVAAKVEAPKATTIVKSEAKGSASTAERKPFTKRPPFNKNVRRMPRRKVCKFCVDKMDKIDYKDVLTLKRFVTEKGKIIPRRQTGVCAKHQRVLATAIKRSRIAALMPFCGE